MVRDSDGSAFISKAEFDSLKNNFQSQIDMYNSSIDAKIDGAIAAYLSGVSVATSEIKSLLFYTPYSQLSLDVTNQIKYAPGYSQFTGVGGYLYMCKPGNTAWPGALTRLTTCSPDPNYGSAIDTSAKPYKKLLISNRDETKKIANWVGYGTDCREIVSWGIGVNEGTTSMNPYSPPATITTKIYTAPHDNCRKYFDDSSFNGIENWSDGNWLWSFSFDNGTTTFNHKAVPNAFNFVNKDDANKIKYKYINVFSNVINYEFQDSSVITNCVYLYDTAKASAKSYQQKLIDSSSAVAMNFSTLADWWGHSLGCYASTKPTMSVGQMKKSSTAYQWTSKEFSSVEVHPDNKTRTGLYCMPLAQGFESCNDWYTEWKQLYNGNYDTIAETYSTSVNSVLVGNDGKKHMAVTAGFPLCEAANERQYKYKFSFDATGGFTDKYVWIKNSPFDLEKKPQDEIDKSDFIKPNDSTKYSWDTTKEAILLTENDVDIIFDAKKDGYIWIKWSEAAGNGGGEIILNNRIEVTRKS